MWLTEWRDLRDLARRVSLQHEPIWKLLVGQTTMNPATLDAWKDGLLRLARQQHRASETIAAIRSLDDTSSRPPEPLLWFYWNDVYRWPNHPKTDAAEMAISWYPQLVADIAIDNMAYYSELNCLCKFLRWRTSPIAPGRGGSGGPPYGPPIWHNQADFLGGWSHPWVGDMSPATVLRRARKDPVALVEQYMSAMIAGAREGMSRWPEGLRREPDTNEAS